jgi:hypothetical protein
MMMLQAGVLWHLLLFMFSYDFTLEEGGVERSEEANQQVSPFVCHKLDVLQNAVPLASSSIAGKRSPSCFYYVTTGIYRQKDVYFV